MMTRLGTQTCHQYYNLVVHSISLQLRMELQANGLELSDEKLLNELGATMLLDRLYEYRDGKRRALLCSPPIAGSADLFYHRLAISQVWTTGAL
jgi:hypothetical protein